MPEEQIQDKLAVVPDQQAISEALQKAAWGMSGSDAPASGEQDNQDNKPAAQQQDQKPAIVKEPEEEILDVNEWLKREFEVDDVNIIKQEREAYKKLKETPPAEEIKFANDQSKQLHELYREGKWKEANKILEQQEKIETYISANVDATTAPEIIKLGMSLKYKDLTPKEIDYKYNKEFATPKEPVQAADELDTDFEMRKGEWQEKVNDIEMNKVIEAKLMRPELEKLKTQLILPEISKKDAQPSAPQPTQEDLEADRKMKETFLKNAENSVKKLMEISTSVKDKDVDLSVKYGISTDQQANISKKMATFAESGFNANALLAERWVNADMTLNTDQIAEDMFWLENRKDVLQKSNTEAANQRLEAYIKGKKNINLQGVQNGADFKPDGDKTHSEKLQEHFWGVN